jgi:hypothetical protein
MDSYLFQPSNTTLYLISQLEFNTEKRIMGTQLCGKLLQASNEEKHSLNRSIPEEWL